MTDKMISSAVFSQFGLAEPIVRAVTEKGYQQATPIQLQAIPEVLAGRDMLACAQTGTGKTAAFTLPLLDRLKQYANTSTSPAMHLIRGLVLVPTRELADQVAESIKIYGQYLGLRTAVVFGGVNIQAQTDQLRKGVEILVATPGRLLDHLQQKTITLNKVEILVLDEADRMLDMGFIDDIRKIIGLLPSKRQSLLFSATFSNEIKKLAEQWLSSPAMIEVARLTKAEEIVEQAIYLVEESAKFGLLSYLINKQAKQQMLVFTRTKKSSEKLGRQLIRAQINTAVIHGDKNQLARMEALAQFKQGKVQVLVATDVAARGLDIDQLPCVMNYELPYHAEDYIHRIGRTGRAGSAGHAFSLVSSEELKLLQSIERLLKRTIPRQPLPDRGEAYVPAISPSERRVAKAAPSHHATSRDKTAWPAKKAEQAVLTGHPTQSKQQQPGIQIPALFLPPSGKKPSNNK